MTPDLDSYDKILVSCSSGKDSLACMLHLFDMKVPAEKIELWHNDIDGHTADVFMDWPCTPGYTDRLGDALGIPVYHSWRQGGFLREMLRDGDPTAPVEFQCPDGRLCCVGGRGPAGTRRKYPQVSADLRVRWCSAYCKIDVFAAALRNQERFQHARTLVLTGERAEESSARARYKEFEPDRSDARKGRLERVVDHWRPVHAWTEERVWDIIERYRINPHPCYHLGWGRCSCAACIFGSPSMWAALYEISPKQVEKIMFYEEEFGVTIKRKESIRDTLKKGEAYPDMDPEMIRQALSRNYTAPVFLQDWKLPAGAFGENAGPT